MEHADRRQQIEVQHRLSFVSVQTVHRENSKAE